MAYEKNLYTRANLNCTTQARRLGYGCLRRYDASVPGPEGMMLRTLDTGTLLLAGSSNNPDEFERGTIYAMCRVDPVIEIAFPTGTDKAAAYRVATTASAGNNLRLLRMAVRYTELSNYGAGAEG